VRTIRFCSVVFGVTSNLDAVIHTIHGRPWLCIVRDRAWSVSHCRATATVTGYRAWRLVVQCPHIRSKRKAGRTCDLQTTVQQLLIAIRYFSLPHLHSTPPLGGVPVGILPCSLVQKIRMVWLPEGKIFLGDIFIRFDRMYERDGRTDRRTDGRTPHDGIGRAYA